MTVSVCLGQYRVSCSLLFLPRLDIGFLVSAVAGRCVAQPCHNGKCARRLSLRRRCTYVSTAVRTSLRHTPVVIVIFFITYSLYRNFFYDFSCLSASAHKSIYAISEFSYGLVGLGSISVFFCPSCLPPANAGQIVPLAIGWGLLLVCGCKINTLFNKNLQGGNYVNDNFIL